MALSPQFLKVFDELMEGMEAVLAAGHMGVIVQLTECCIEREEKQANMMRGLLTVSGKTTSPTALHLMNIYSM